MESIDTPIETFSFGRKRGIVWVCDVANSSKLLNDDVTVDDGERFLQRLYWLSYQAVHSIGGQYIKWTGDGFVAWFETKVERNVPEIIERIAWMAWQLTALIKTSQLSLDGDRFAIKHALTYEPDAIAIESRYRDGHRSLDLMGRKVVLAFRMTSLASAFPNIVIDSFCYKNLQSRRKGDFEKWKADKVGIDKYFKGERFGTNGIYLSTKKTSRNQSLKRIVTQGRKVIRLSEGQLPYKDLGSVEFCERLENGPPWAVDAFHKYISWAAGVKAILGDVLTLLETRGQEETPP